jgi:putative N6-adenine-specific DNA methylase
MAPGLKRRFAFEKMLPFQAHVWQGLKQQAEAAITEPTAPVFGSDVSFRMVDFAQRNAERAGVAHAVQLRGGDALQRMPPAPSGVMLVNPPYGERIDVAGVAGQSSGGREQAQSASGEGLGEFFQQLASHWKKYYAGWTAHLLTPDLKLPGKMRLKESRRVPMWNGPIECRLFRFDLVAGSPRKPEAAPSGGAAPGTPAPSGGG